MSPRSARCHCGDLQLRCEGEPAKVSMCHCLDCQRRTGSAFSVAVFYPVGKVAIGGETRVFNRPSASGFAVNFHFCPRCGSNVFWRPERMPHLVGVAAGAFGDPDFSAPQQAVWTKDRHAWVTLPDGMPCFEAGPTAKTSL